MTIDLSERQIERTSRGVRAVNPPPLLVDTNDSKPIMKAAVLPVDDKLTYSVESLIKGYYRHFASGQCPWADDPLRPSVIELINCLVDCGNQDYDTAVIHANAILGRLARGQ